MSVMFGGAGAAIMAVAIMISTFGCNNGLILAGARVYYAMAQDGLFFKATGRLNARHVPAMALVLQGIWTALLVLPRTRLRDPVTDAPMLDASGAEQYGNLYGTLLDYVVFAVLIFYVLTIAGLFVLRRTRPDAERPYRAFGYPVLPAFYIVAATVILLVLAIYRTQTSWPGLLIVLAGVPVYFLWRKSRPAATDICLTCRGGNPSNQNPTMNLFRRKSVTDLQAEALSDHSLKRALGPMNLTALGVGAIIGTGIFVLTGTVAAQNAGPAVVLSFVLAGIASVFAALCYSEFASLVPMAGSAYTYGYATLGELVAWIIGWDLILEYAVGAITVAIGWSGYVVSFLHDFGIDIPPALSAARGTELIELPAALAALLKAKAGWVVSSGALLDQIKAVGNRPGDAPSGHRDLQSASRAHHFCRHDAAGGWHQGIGELQQRHRAW